MQDNAEKPNNSFEGESDQCIKCARLEMDLRIMLASSIPLKELQKDNAV